MKSILKKLFLVSFLFVLGIVGSTYVNAKDEIGTEEELQVYQIRSKDEGIITDKKVFSFYEENNEKLNNLIEQKKQEESARLEAERLEQEKLEQEKLEQERQFEIEKNNELQSQNVVSVDANSDIASYALQFVGNPYVAGGTSLTNGTDCSGFVMSVYAAFGISLPRTTGAQATSGYGVSISDAQPGDIVSYGYNGYVSHSALYIGNGMIVHASTPELGIRVDSMYIMPIITIRRIG